MKLSNTVAGIFRSKLTGSPFYIRFQVIDRCNYRCRMCGQRKGSMKPLKELSLHEIEILAKNISKLGAKHLVLTGGEPFLRKDIPEIIAIFKRYNFSIRIQTNGGPQVTEEIFKRCVENGLDDISVSIDTLNAGLQDEICQGKDVVRNAIRVLQMAKKMMPHSISQANIVASSFNFHELTYLVQYFFDLGIYTYITPVMVSSSDTHSHNDYRFREKDQEDFNPDDLEEQHRDVVVKELMKLRKKGIGLTNSLRFIKDYWIYLSTGRNDWKCDAGAYSLDIYADGGVSICKEKGPFGNILDGDFIEKYRSKEFHEIRSKQISSCSGCFYGEYREPSYVINSFAVLLEWTSRWLRTFHRGMLFKRSEKNFTPNAEVSSYES